MGFQKFECEGDRGPKPTNAVANVADIHVLYLQSSKLYGI
jgi:hypothetical protein